MNFMLPTGGFDLAGYQAAMIAAAAQMAQESAQAAAKAVSNFNKISPKWEKILQH